MKWSWPRKFELYETYFIQEINAFKKAEKVNEKKEVATYRILISLIRRKSIEEIAELRK